MNPRHPTVKAPLKVRLPVELDSHRSDEQVNAGVFAEYQEAQGFHGFHASPTAYGLAVGNNPSSELSRLASDAVLAGLTSLTAAPVDGAASTREL